jgi:beta-glucanase (GH16 family)
MRSEDIGPSDRVGALRWPPRTLKEGMRVRLTRRATDTVLPSATMTRPMWPVPCLAIVALALLLLPACAPPSQPTRHAGGASATDTPGPSTPTVVEPTASPTPNPAAQLPGWTLVWDDEFDAATLDATKWTVVSDAPGGFHICCLDEGLQAWAPTDVSIVGGNLRLTTERRAFQRKAYTSGAVVTKGKFDYLYGRLDIRARMPSGDGIWPAFWLLPSNFDSTSVYAPYEVDVMEQLGQTPNIDYMVHWWGGYHDYCQYTGPDFSAGYHVYTFVWTQTAITWLIDGVQRCRFTQAVPNTRMYLILNDTIGGSWPIPPDRSTVLPQFVDIDYVRVYTPGSPISPHRPRHVN